MPQPPAYPPPIPGAQPVLVVVSDLFFRAKIDAVARLLGLPLRVARSAEQLERHLATLRPSLVLVDLEADSIDPVVAIERLKQADVGAPVIGFASHTNPAVLRAARAAGADEVMARSGFQVRLPGLLEEVAAGARARAGAPPPGESS